jgi:hypothetical protein
MQIELTSGPIALCNILVTTLSFQCCSWSPRTFSECNKARNEFQLLFQENYQFAPANESALRPYPEMQIKTKSAANMLSYLAYLEGDAAFSSRSNELQWSEVVDPAVIDALHAFEVLPTRDQSWLHEALSFLESTMTQGRQEFWVPTVCHNLLVAIAKNTGDYALTLAEFSHFPGASSGTNGPVVQRVERGKCVVYPTVTDAPMGHCDIMFPTDFVGLAGAFRKCIDQIAVGRKAPCTVECRVLSHKDFFQLFADDDDPHRSTCADGFNPVLAEFSNQSILAIDVTSGRDDCRKELVKDYGERA